ncbi:hypothetical protein AB0H88_17665 [Nonomuraea sp. NPDC050680]|uniref:hypothetical protein n=1 Tax=Nonomuraea sp. NPDC050680 TaxID=3154630 RepID=UPI0033C3098A
MRLRAGFTEKAARIGRIAATVLGAVLMASGCVFSSAKVTLRVDPAALDDVRGIGEVRAEASHESERDGKTQVSRELVIDVGATSGREALDKAADLLAARKWVITTQNRPTIVLMESARWGETYATLRPFDPAYFEDKPEVLEQLKKASVKEEPLVYLDVYEGTI